MLITTAFDSSLIVTLSSVNSSLLFIFEFNTILKLSYSILFKSNIIFKVSFCAISSEFTEKNPFSLFVPDIA